MADMYLATKADFDQCLKDAGSKVVCVDFTATWCPPCKMIGPKFEAMVADYPNCILKKVDVDANTDTPAKFGVRGIPTLIIFKNGEAAATKVGALSKTQLMEFVDANI